MGAKGFKVDDASTPETTAKEPTEVALRGQIITPLQHKVNTYDLPALSRAQQPDSSWTFLGSYIHRARYCRWCKSFQCS